MVDNPNASYSCNLSWCEAVNKNNHIFKCTTRHTAQMASPIERSPKRYPSMRRGSFNKSKPSNPTCMNLPRTFWEERPSPFTPSLRPIKSEITSPPWFPKSEPSSPSTKVLLLKRKRRSTLSVSSHPTKPKVSLTRWDWTRARQMANRYTLWTYFGRRMP